MNTPFMSEIAQVRYHVVHETRYNYQSRVTLSQQYLHMTPRSFSHQQVEAHRLRIEPEDKEEGGSGIDYFGNATRHIAITAAHKTLLVHAESTVALIPRYRISELTENPPWEVVRDSVHQGTTAEALDACRYLYASPHVVCSPELAHYGRVSYVPGRPQLDAAMDLTRRIFEEFKFDSTATTISTPLAEVLKGRRGVCQDFAHLMIGCLRSIGLPARYVSGYILTHPPAGQPRLIGSDASHAWVSVFCPGSGWIDFDPTNHCIVRLEHVTLGWGRDFSDVTPMRGIVLGGGKQRLEVRVTVTPLQ